MPLMVRWPGKIKAGASSDALVANYDFMATMADLVDFELPQFKDGVSYLPELLGENHKERDYVVYSSFFGPAIVSNDGWKLRYYAADDIFQLYYLPEDYREEENLLEGNEEIAEKLKKILIEECDGDLNNGWFRLRKRILSFIK